MIPKILEDLQNPAVITAGATVIIALIGILKFVIPSQKTKRGVSRREMINIVKEDIHILTSSTQGRAAWQRTVAISQKYEGGGLGPKIGTLAELLAVRDSKYKANKWIELISVALEELIQEGYRGKLGL